MAVVNRTDRSITPATFTAGTVTSMEVPFDDVTCTMARLPNQTNTGTVVGKCPWSVIRSPPEVYAERGDAESSRHGPDTSGGGAGVVVTGCVVPGAPGVVVPGTAVVPGPDGWVVGVVRGGVVVADGCVVPGLAVVTGLAGDVVVVARGAVVPGWVAPGWVVTGWVVPG